jgi:hypothetical protein
MNKKMLLPVRIIDIINKSFEKMPGWEKKEFISDFKLYEKRMKRSQTYDAIFCFVLGILATLAFSGLFNRILS